MKNKLILAAFYVFLGVLTRTIFHVGENIEFITAIGIGNSVFLNKKFLNPVLFTLLILAFSDLIIGNTNILYFTWSGFLAAPLLGLLVKANTKKLKFADLLKADLVGVISTLIFFLWTNFGVVVTTSMYSKDLAGVIDSYTNALPFLFNQLMGNLIIVPLVFVLSHLVFNFQFQHLSKFDSK